VLQAAGTVRQRTQGLRVLLSPSRIIIRHSKPSNYHSLSYFLLSVVFAKSRRYTPKFNCLSFMNWRETLHLLFYERGKRVKEEGVGGDLADRLCKQPFFCRFSRNLVVVVC
jgi:hypothetical protein